MEKTKELQKRKNFMNYVLSVIRSDELTAKRIHGNGLMATNHPDIFLAQNKPGAPPGKLYIMGSARGHPPEPIESLNQISNQISNNQIFTKINKSFLLNILNFFIMKKQILFIVVFVLAAFAGTKNSYGQCIPAPLTPAAGVEYDYGVTITSTGSGGTYLWYVTEGTDLLTGTKILVADGDFTVGAGSAYNNTTGGTNNLKLTWTPKSISRTFYLVVKYTETSTSGCVVENLKVYEVKPINTFLLAVAGSDLAGVEANATTCPANVIGAVVTAAAPTVAYTYGQNSIYYKVTASGILGDWKPSIRIPALAGLGQNYADADWTSDGGTTWHTFPGVAGNTAGGDFTSTDDANVSNVAGTPIIVRLRINNVNYESLAAQPIEIGVDGTLPTAYTVSDIQGGLGATACDPEVAFGKKGTHTIEARPTVAPNIVTGGFITKAP